jgi:vacuolar-type H+-ATPase subunit I/STV1
MRDEGHLLRRAGREFAKNLLWMVVAFGILVAILVAATSLPLVGVTLVWVMAFVGAAAAIMAAIVTALVLGSDAHDETPVSGLRHRPGVSPDRGGWPDGGGGADGGGGGG